MDQVRLGVIGCGGMGRAHMAYFADVSELRYTAAADSVEENLRSVVEKYGVMGFDSGHALIESGEVDAVLIATPHYFHPEYAKSALEHGVHVLTEKPVAVTAKAAAEVNAVHAAQRDLIYAVMYQLRLEPRWQAVKELIDSGQLGDVHRIHWTMTDWFRTQAYFDSGGWRATWRGEGGGVLLNQASHNIDMLYWLFGRPKRVQAHIRLGRYHRIEVEDDVTAYLEYENGATGLFITSTGEYPGENRMEIVGNRGHVVLEKAGPIRLIKFDMSSDDFIRTSPTTMGSGPAQTKLLIEPPDPDGHQFHKVMEAFLVAILHRDPSRLVAPGEEGLYCVEMANAMISSGITGQPVDLPMDYDAYEDLLKDLVTKSQMKG